MTDQERNEAVARKLGYRADLPASSPIGDSVGCLWIKGDDASKHYRLPPYSTSIEAAWEIVDWLFDNGYSFTLQRGVNGKRFSACISKHNDMAILNYEHSDEDPAPLAICNAFLKLP